MSHHDHGTRAPTTALERARYREQARRSHQAELAGARAPLDVKVDELIDAGIDVDTVIGADAVTALLDEGKEIEWSGTGDARITLHLEEEAGFVRANGTAHFALSHPCVRCLNQVPFDVMLNVDLRLVRSEGAPDAKLLQAEEGAGELDAASLGEEIEDIGIASYTGDTIHLDEVLREQLFLELPMHPACDSPRARPTEPCAFDATGALRAEQERWVDPRWAGLLKLKDQLAASPFVPKLESAAAPEVVPLPGKQTPIPLPGGRPLASAPTRRAAKPAPAKKAKPAAKKAKPAAKKAKPAAKKAKPAAKKAKPAKKGKTTAKAKKSTRKPPPNKSSKARRR